mmetsp:Transcript_20098/g.49995  ORF Transcript_20098/g.49995 Transcript_20098/m.49995 type:complete len:99 (-) Transcript_20098:10-306(-)
MLGRFDMETEIGILRKLFIQLPGGVRSLLSIASTNAPIALQEESHSEDIAQALLPVHLFLFFIYAPSTLCETEGFFGFDVSLTSPLFYHIIYCVDLVK